MMNQHGKNHAASKVCNLSYVRITKTEEMNHANIPSLGIGFL